MGYINIPSLLKDDTILGFKKVWATEKIHGTSAWIMFDGKHLFYHKGGSGSGAPVGKFDELFDREVLLEKLTEVFGHKKVRLHGEFYGGKIQHMGQIYGDYGFVLFDICICDSSQLYGRDLWLSFDKVQEIGKVIGLDVVAGEIIPATRESIEKITNTPSELARKRGMGKHIREGIVLRPLIELIKNNDKRVIAKYKTEKYGENRNQPRITDVGKIEARKKLEKDARKVAFDWVTEMRLSHVLDKFELPLSRKDTKAVIDAMVMDVKKEAGGLVEFTREVVREIGKSTVKLFHDRLEN